MLFRSKKVVCESNIKVVIDLVNSVDIDLIQKNKKNQLILEFSFFGGLIGDIHDQRKREWQCSFHHVLREGNFGLKALAKSACDIELGFDVLHSPPIVMVM